MSSGLQVGSIQEMRLPDLEIAVLWPECVVGDSEAVSTHNVNSQETLLVFLAFAYNWASIPDRRIALKTNDRRLFVAWMRRPVGSDLRLGEWEASD